MELTDLLGITAGILTTASFVPQVIKTYRSRSAKDISGAMFIALAVGVVLWIAYGFLTGSFPVIIANSCTLVLVAGLLALKIKYR